MPRGNAARKAGRTSGPGTAQSPDVGETKLAVTLVDVGGTKELILIVGVDRDGSLLRDRIYAKSDEIKTPFGTVKHFYDETANAIREIQKTAGNNVKLLPIVCVGSPGRLVKGVIQPGSAANLGNMPHEFDGVMPAKEIEKRLNAKVYVDNDAIAQMCAGLHTLFERPDLKNALSGRKVCYVGPGTGTGGGFCTVRKDITIDICTDGHIYDMMIPGYEGKFRFPFICDTGRYEAELPYERTKLEDLLSGRAVRQIACAIDRRLLNAGAQPLFLPALPRFKAMMGEEMFALIDHDNKESPINARFLRETFLHPKAMNAVIDRARPIAQSIFEFEGLMLSKLMECIYTGNINKFSRDAQWNKSDKEKVKGTRDYIIGGSVGTRGVGGRLIQETARRFIADRFPDVVFRIYPLDPEETGNAGAYGAFDFADRKVLLGEISKKSNAIPRARR